jgi:hypothetical protein
MIYLGLSAKKYVDVIGPDRFWSFLGRTGLTTAPPVEKIQPFKGRNDEGERISRKREALRRKR